jgi:hypothetical protein
MEPVEVATKTYAEARDHLVGLVKACNDEQKAIAELYVKDIKLAVRSCVDKLAKLRETISTYKHLFVRPKTACIHGYKVGFKKAPGAVEYDNEEQVVKLIKKHFPDRTIELIITKEVPSKDAIQRLSVADLAKIGCSLVNTAEKVVVSSLVKDSEKLVAALLKEHSSDTEVEAEACA